MAVHSKIWYLQHFRMLDALSEPQMRLVDRLTRMLEVRRGTPIYLEGDPSDQIFLLKSGAVKISCETADGEQTLLAFLHPGDLFGELAIVDEAPRDHVATAHEDTVLCAMDRAMVLQVVQDTPALGYQITKLMGLRLRRFRMRVEELLCKSAPDRVAHALLDLAAECAVRDQRGLLIRLRLNQADLGHLVGLARETVNIVLQDFRSRGLIEIEGRRIRITDPEGLRGPVPPTT
jgi:CRP-like cAMP-binding protein